MRGIDLKILENWTKGPTFLFTVYKEIPSNEHQNLEFGNDHDILKQMKGMTPKNSLRKEKQHPKTGCVAAALDFKPRNPTLESLLTTCSSFIKVRTVLAYVLRFVHNLRQKSKDTGAISVGELRRSETFLYKWAQENLNREDVGKSLTARKDDQGILRAHRRLEKIASRNAEPDHLAAQPQDCTPPSQTSAREKSPLWLQEPHLRVKEKVLDYWHAEHCKTPHKKLHRLSQVTTKTSTAFDGPAPKYTRRN